jgi:hypothetical protein
MFIEFVESLRCLRPHDRSWLVAAVDRLERRRIIEGSLGCPECRSTYRIHAGVTDFREIPLPDEATSAFRGGDATEVWSGDADRARALLNLDSSGGTIALIGAAAALHATLAAETEAHYLFVNPGIPPGIATDASVLLCGDSLPLAPACLRAALVRHEAATPVLLESLSGALQPGGRLVAPAGSPIPPGITLLARDDREWVGARDASASAPVLLGRRRTPDP